MNAPLTFHVLPERYALCRFAPSAIMSSEVLSGVFTSAFSSGFCSVSRSATELSIACEERHIPASFVSVGGGTETKAETKAETKIDRGWRVLHLDVMDLSLTGVAARFTAVLAAADVAVNVIATFDTDYVLIKADMLARAVEALRQAGYTIEAPVDDF